MNPGYVFVFFLVAAVLAWWLASCRSTQSRPSSHNDRSDPIRRAIHLANEEERFDDAIRLCRRVVQRSRNPIERHNALVTIEDIRTEVRARRNEKVARSRAEEQLETLEVNVNPERELATFPELFPEPHQVPDPEWDEEDWIAWVTRMNAPDVRQHLITTPTTRTQPWDDPQNVHDSAVQDDVVANLERMARESSPTAGINDPQYRNLPDTERLTAAIGRLSEPRKREEALVALNYIRVNRNASLTRPGCTIGQVFSVVEHYISREPQEERQAIMYDRLALELADCTKPDGGLLCLTGITTRIVGCLDGLDDQVHIRPEWAIREELMSRAGVHHVAGREPAEIRRLLHEEYDPQIGPARLEGYIAGWLEAL